MFRTTLSLAIAAVATKATVTGTVVELAVATEAATRIGTASKAGS